MYVELIYNEEVRHVSPVSKNGKLYVRKYLKIATYIKSLKFATF